MADVFISYSREDPDVAFRMDRLLEQEGWSTWIDREIGLGEDFRPDIEREIDAAACVVVIWTPAAVASRWVRQEALRALAQRKLVEVELSPGLASQIDLSEAHRERSPAIAVGERVQVDPAREELLARMATVGHLARPRDSWNASLVACNWRARPPSHPIIAWEWVGAGGEAARICRRERWVEGPTSEYRTTIGNFWQFGYEGTQVALGYLTITKSRHEVTLPERNQRREREASRLVVPFTEGGTAGELLSDANYPRGGVSLDPDQQVGVDAIETACREHLNADSDPGSYLYLVSNDTGDPFEFDVSIEVFMQPMVWCKLVPRKRIRDRQKLERTITTLRELEWNPPRQGTSEGGWVLGRRLTQWWHDVGPLGVLDYRGLATLLLNTFLAVYGGPPAGWSSATTTTPVRHPSEPEEGRSTG